MCRQMTQIRVTPEVIEKPKVTPEQSQGTPEQPKVTPEPTTQVEFRKLLLTKCQREFEKEQSDREHLLELKKKMEENTNPVNYF